VRARSIYEGEIMSVSSVGKPRSAADIQRDWATNPRWKGITRT
jgi:hypothetical protein